MDIINNNPFRITGVLANATTKEFERQKTKIKAFSKVGREIKSDYDFQILDSISRSEDSIYKAYSSIQQNQDKVNFALFWFLNANPFDNTALEYLKNGDAEKAVEIWEKVTINKEVNSKNFSAFNNLGTYKLLSQTQNDIKEGIEAKIKLIESDYFESFVNAVADETFTIDNEKQIEKMVDELLTQFKNRYSSSETLELFSNCNGSTQKYLSKKFAEEPIHKIESQIEICKKKRNKNKGEAYQLGLNLVSKSKVDLVFLQSLLGTTDLKYKTIADQLANEIMQCGIDYFNSSQENNSSENYLESAQELAKIADKIAIGKLTKDRAKDNLASLEEMKDRELNQAIDFLQSIKVAYENNARQLMAQVKEQEAAMGYGQSINYNKVAELLKNSIDWDKAIELIQNVIPQKNISKIKNVQNSSKIDEYKKLVEFILEKLNYTQKSKIQYLQYWTPSSTKSSTPRTSTTTNNTSWVEENPGCLIAIIVIGIIILANILKLI